MPHSHLRISLGHSLTLQAGMAIALILASAPLAASEGKEPPKSCPDDPMRCPPSIARVTILTFDTNRVLLSSYTYQIAPTGVSVTITVQMSAIFWNPASVIKVETAST